MKNRIIIIMIFLPFLIPVAAFAFTGEEIIRKADWIVDIGKGAGANGGEIIARGTPEDIEEEKNSITGQYLRGAKSIKIPEKRRQENGKNLVIIDAHKNNLMIDEFIESKISSKRTLGNRISQN